MEHSPAVYTHGHPEPVLRSHRWRTAENSAGYLLPRLRSGLSVLDVGCGPGTITADLARIVAPGPVLGIDRAPEVVAAATTDHPAENLSFRTGDVDALDAQAGTFDVVHAHQVLQHLADPVRALAEMRRVCKPGGVVAVRDADYAAMTWWPASAGMDRWLEIYRSVARRNGGEPDAGRRLPEWARAAGFREITVSASVWCFATPEDRDWWGGMWAERISQPPLSDRAVECGVASAGELEVCAGALREWVAAPDGCFFVVHGEVLAIA